MVSSEMNTMHSGIQLERVDIREKGIQEVATEPCPLVLIEPVSIDHILLQRIEVFECSWQRFTYPFFGFLPISDGFISLLHLGLPRTEDWCVPGR